MPGIQCSYNGITRIDVPIPFFLRDDPFIRFRDGDYDWNTTQNLTMLVKKIERLDSNSSDGQEDTDVMKSSVEGCPLECPFNIQESFEEVRASRRKQLFEGLRFNTINYAAMDLSVCRRLVKKIYDRDDEVINNLCLHPEPGKMTPLKPIYVPCDGVKDVVMIGFDDEKFLELRMMGPYKQHNNQLSLDHFINFHQHLPHVNHSVINKHVHAIYERVTGESDSKGKVYLECLWNNPNKIFESPPETALIKLAVQPKMGDAHPCLKMLWNEIKTLEKIMDTAEVQILPDKSSSLLHAPTFDTEHDALKKLKTLMTEQGSQNWRKRLDFSSTLEMVLQRISDKNRTDFDFTDLCWSIVQNCSPLELFECLYYVLSSVETKNYRPFLLPRNTTALAQLLHQIISNEVKNFRPKICPAKVVEMVLDCGLTKLRKDYFFVFRACDLVESNELKQFEESGKVFKDRLSDLKKLHCIVETLCLSKDRFSLPSSELGAQAKKLLNHFSFNKVNSEETFHFDVSYSSVSGALLMLNPMYWNLRLESAYALRAARTNAILSRDLLVGHATKNYMLGDETNPRGYYLYVLRIAQRRA